MINENSTIRDIKAELEKLRINLKNPRIEKVLRAENFDLNILIEAINKYLMNILEFLETNDQKLLMPIFTSIENLIKYSEKPSFRSYVHPFINEANFLIESMLKDEIIKEEEFSKRYEKLINILKFENEEKSNLILETPSDNVPFQLFKNQNNSIIVLTKNGSKNSMTKDKLANIIYREGSTKNLSYEPVIIEKILDNSIFDLIQNSNVSFYNGNKIEESEVDKLKTLARIQELEEKVEKMKNDADEIEKLRIKSEKIVTNCENAESAFHQKMQTKQSFTFWREQEKVYYKRYQNYIFISFIAITVMLVMTWYFLHNTHLSIFSIISNFTDNNTTIKSEEILTKKELWEYALLILTITLSLWFVRILMKIALSNYHLAIDAKERIVMIQTHLALTEEGKGFEQDDKKVILDNIFRPTNHGIIKDEASITISDILSALKSK